MTRFGPHAVAWMFTAAVVSGAAGQDTEASGEEPSFKWPAPKVLRFEEDYSGLADLEVIPARDWADELKYLPLNDAGDIWLSLGGHARWRGEGFSNFAFGGPADDDDGFYFLHRYFLWGDVHVGRHFRAFVEGKSAWTEDRDLPGGRRGLDQDSPLDVQNLFGEVRLDLGADETTKLIIRGGRQELLYGKQRLISPLDWANTRRTFDGATARLDGGSWTVDAFWTRPVVVDKFDPNDWYKNDQDFWGVYGTVRQVAAGASFDAYFLGREIDAPDIDRYTIGGRMWGACGDSGFKYDIEGGYQFGDAGDDDIDAFFFASEVSYTFADAAWKPWLAVGFDYASGDDDPDDGDVGTFDQLFPLGHAYLGYIDIVGRQNIVALRLSGKVTPAPKWWLKADLHAFWRAEDEDALYSAGGGVVRPGDATADDFIGFELDLTAGYTFNHRWKALLGYSHFFPGDFIDDTGVSDDIDFWYAQLQFTF